MHRILIEVRHDGMPGKEQLAVDRLILALRSAQIELSDETDVFIIRDPVIRGRNGGPSA